MSRSRLCILAAISAVLVLFVVVTKTRQTEKTVDTDTRVAAVQSQAPARPWARSQPQPQALPPLPGVPDPQQAQKQTGEPVDPAIASTQEGAIRLVRHAAVYQYLHSPARDTEACQQLVAICQKYQLGPWAVPLAYNIAWEADIQAGMLGGFVDKPEMHGIMAEVNRRKTEKMLEQEQARFGVQLDPGFIEEAAQVKPTAFFGPAKNADPSGRMLDQMSWAEISD